MSGTQQLSRTEHSVMLFDSETTRASAVAAFILQARSSGAPVAVLATGPHWEAIVRASGERAALISRGLAAGTIAFRDAEVLLYDISRGGLPRRELFDQAITELLRSLPQGRVHVYGELVDLLAGRGDFDAALRLEQLWNDRLAREPMSLLCGYDATVFAPDRTTPRLRQVCGCHAEVRVSPDDTLGNWLLTQAAVDVVNS